MASPTSLRQGDVPNGTFRPERPCDACRRRKSRCVVNTDSTSCVMCEFHHRACTFIEDSAPRRRKPVDVEGQPRRKRAYSPSDSQPSQRQPENPSRTGTVVGDYASLHGESLLKENLGLQNHYYAKYIGPTDEHESSLLDLQLQDETNGNSPSDVSSFRKVAPNEFFQQYADSDHPTYATELEDLDRIEEIVQPHGEALIRLYFRIVHPSFPILHKKVWLEKYARSHREFSPPCMAAVYILALNWWSYSTELARQEKPDVLELEQIALRTLRERSERPKLATVQAGLLLLQRPSSTQSWQLICQLVAMGQDLGLHQDCTNWKIPSWERGLRKRLAWALFMQDTWAALIFGRPSHITSSNWAVKPVVGSDFPENFTDESDEDGSTEVEKGRTLFSAMITLTHILSEALDALYSLRAEMEIKNSSDSTRTVLERAKPIQVKLRSWYTDMPEILRIDTTRVGKLNSVGYLHLAYIATEITLHRRIIRSLSPNTDPYMIQICRSAAKTRLISAIDIFNKLKPEHLQSFWFFASRFNVTLIGTFAGLCLVTSVSEDEVEFYQQRLQEFRWALRVSSKSAEFLEIASNNLESAVGHLVKLGDESASRRASFPMLQTSVDEDNSLDNLFATTEQSFYDIQMEV